MDPQMYPASTPPARPGIPWLIIVLSSTFFLLAGLLLGQRLFSKPAPASVASPDLIPAWKTYSNAAWKYQFNYPDDWKIVSEINPDPEKAEALRVMFNTNSPYYEFSLEGNPRDLEIVQSHLLGNQIQIGGIHYYVVDAGINQGKTTYLYYTGKPGFTTPTFLIKVPASKVSFWDPTKQILSSFKFLDNYGVSQTVSIDKYQIDIPANWSRLRGEGNSSLTYSNGDFHFVLEEIPTTFKTIQSYLADSDQKMQTAWEGQPSFEILSTKITKIGSYSVVKREEKWLASGMAKPVIVTYFLRNNIIYSLQLRYLGVQPDSSTWAESDYNQILSSFRLL